MKIDFSKFEENLDAGVYDNKLDYPNSSDMPKDNFRNLRQIYGTETCRLNNLFRSDLEKVYSFENHCKKDLLWHLAWEEGHSNGLHEVYIYYSKFAEFLTIEKSKPEKQYTDEEAAEGYYSDGTMMPWLKDLIKDFDPAKAKANANHWNTNRLTGVFDNEYTAKGDEILRLVSDVLALVAINKELQHIGPIVEIHNLCTNAALDIKDKLTAIEELSLSTIEKMEGTKTDANKIS